MISKLKRFIKFIIYFIIKLLIKPSKEIKQKSLLLIRLDAIGDYVLFRNFIEVLKKSEKYKEYNITLLGNSAWKGLSKELDSEFVDTFIWLDRRRFDNNFIYRYNKLKEITSNAYEIIISSTYSREFMMSDIIVHSLNAKEKIGSSGDLSNTIKWKKDISDKYYTKLIPAKRDVIFEFYRNKEFFENLLHVTLNITRPSITLKQNTSTFDLPDRYALFFIGAGLNYRKWDPEKFSIVAKYLKENHGYNIVLCGAKTDINDAKEFTKHYQGDVLDLVGKTSLIELLYIINNAKFMLSNETSAPHLAIALKKKNIFVIYNGTQYGRFTPYPKNINNSYHIIYHPEIEKDLENYKRLSNTYGYSSTLDIKKITTQDVIKKIEQSLHKNYQTGGT